MAGEAARKTPSVTHAPVIRRPIRFKNEPPEQFPRTLQEKNFWVLGGRQMRLSSHIHTRPRDIEEFFQVADDVLAG